MDDFIDLIDDLFHSGRFDEAGDLLSSCRNLSRALHDLDPDELYKRAKSFEISELTFPPETNGVLERKLGEFIKEALQDVHSLKEFEEAVRALSALQYYEEKDFSGFLSQLPALIEPHIPSFLLRRVKCAHIRAQFEVDIERASTPTLERIRALERLLSSMEAFKANDRVIWGQCDVLLAISAMHYSLGAMDKALARSSFALFKITALAFSRERDDFDKYDTELTEAQTSMIISRILNDVHTLRNAPVLDKLRDTSAAADSLPSMLPSMRYVNTFFECLFVISKIEIFRTQRKFPGLLQIENSALSLSNLRAFIISLTSPPFANFLSSYDNQMKRRPQLLVRPRLLHLIAILSSQISPESTLPAVRLLTEALGTQPRINISRLALGKVTEAEEVFLRYLQKASDGRKLAVLSVNCLGVCHSLKGDSITALERFKSAYDLDFEAVHALSNMAVQYEKLRDFDSAQQTLFSLIEAISALGVDRIDNEEINDHMDTLPLPPYPPKISKFLLFPKAMSLYKAYLKCSKLLCEQGKYGEAALLLQQACVVALENKVVLYDVVKLYLARVSAMWKSQAEPIVCLSVVEEILSRCSLRSVHHLQLYLWKADLLIALSRFEDALELLHHIGHSMSEIEDKLLQSTRDVNGMEIEGQERSGDIESMKSRKLRLSVKAKLNNRLGLMLEAKNNSHELDAALRCYETALALAPDSISFAFSLVSLRLRDPSIATRVHWEWIKWRHLPLTPTSTLTDIGDLLLELDEKMKRASNLRDDVGSPSEREVLELDVLVIATLREATLKLMLDQDHVGPITLDE